jgi:hypothetical protein
VSCQAVDIAKHGRGRLAGAGPGYSDTTVFKRTPGSARVSAPAGWRPPCDGERHGRRRQSPRLRDEGRGTRMVERLNRINGRWVR